jgi:hypothetical protein
MVFMKKANEGAMLRGVTLSISKFVCCGSGFPAATIEAESLSYKRDANRL